MDANQFKSWRKANHLKQKDAAELLGLKKRMIQYYEKGHRDGRSVKIPKSIRLACYAISAGVMDFDGKDVRSFDTGDQPRKHSEPAKDPSAGENTANRYAVSPDAPETAGNADK
ncbi:MAG: helix-turn-helix transcriptional regulator [Pseudomonadota bacterium]